MFIFHNIRKIVFIIIFSLKLFYSKYIFNNKIKKFRYLDLEKNLEENGITCNFQNLIDKYYNKISQSNYYYDYFYKCEYLLFSFFFETKESVMKHCSPSFLPFLIFFILSLILIFAWIFYYICYYNNYCCFNKNIKINCNKKFSYIFTFILYIIIFLGCIFGIILTYIYYKKTNEITCSVSLLYYHLKNGDDVQYDNYYSYYNIKWKGVDKTIIKLNEIINYLPNINEEIKKLEDINSYLQNYNFDDYLNKINSIIILHPNFEKNENITPIYLNDINNIKKNKYLSDFISFINITTHTINILSNKSNVYNLINIFSNSKNIIKKIDDSFKEYKLILDNFLKIQKSINKFFIVLIYILFSLIMFLSLSLIIFLIFYLNYQQKKQFNKNKQKNIIKNLIYIILNLNQFFLIIFLMLGSIIVRLDVFSKSAIGFNYFLLDHFNFSETNYLFSNNETIYKIVQNLFNFKQENLLYNLSISTNEIEVLNYFYENNVDFNIYENNITNLFKSYYDILYNLDNLDFSYYQSNENMNSYINDFEKYTDVNNKNTYQYSFNNFYNIWNFNCSSKKYPSNNNLIALGGVGNKECYYISNYNKINISNYQTCLINNDKYENLLQISELYLNRFYNINININEQFNEIFNFLEYYNKTIYEYLNIYSNISYKIQSIFNESIGDSNNILDIMILSFFNRDINLIHYLNDKFKNKTIFYGTYMIVFSWILFISNIFTLIVIHTLNKEEFEKISNTEATNTSSSNLNNNQIIDNYDKATIEQSGVINITDFIREDI